jgi:hypothetical protein
VTAAIDAAIRTLEAISLYFGELRMLSRALILATVMLPIGCFAAAPAHAQATNLEAGKSPSQIFAGTCTACHKSPRGLLKSVPAGSLPGFLRQHYTTSPEMAGVLSSFLISNGAADTRYGGGQGKPDKDAKSDGRAEGKPGGPPQQLDRQGRPIHVSREPAKPEAEPQQAAKPDADGISPREEGGRKGRNARRLARPAEEGAKPAEGEAAAREARERGPDGRKLSAKQRLGRRGKPVEEMPKEMPKGDKGDAAKTDSGKEEPASATATKEDKPAGETAKDDSIKPSDEGKPATAKSDTSRSDTAKSDTAKVESPNETAPKEPAGETPAVRADPVPAVTPAPAAPPAASAATSSGMPEPVTASSLPSAKPASPVAPSSAPPATQSAASEPAAAPAPPPAAAAPAGPPQPPISR